MNARGDDARHDDEQREQEPAPARHRAPTAGGARARDGSLGGAGAASARARLARTMRRRSPRRSSRCATKFARWSGGIERIHSRPRSAGAARRPRRRSGLPGGAPRAASMRQSRKACSAHAAACARGAEQDLAQRAHRLGDRVAALPGGPRDRGLDRAARELGARRAVEAERLEVGLGAPPRAGPVLREAVGAHLERPIGGLAAAARGPPGSGGRRSSLRGRSRHEKVGPGLGQRACPLLEERAQRRAARRRPGRTWKTRRKPPVTGFFSTNCSTSSPSSGAPDPIVTTPWSTVSGGSAASSLPGEVDHEAPDVVVARSSRVASHAAARAGAAASSPYQWSV